MYATEVICYETGPRRPYKITNTFLDCRTEINADGTKHLNLHGRQVYDTIRRRIQNRDLVLICEYLLDDPKIVSVQLCYNNISHDGMYILAKFLKDNNTVKSLDLMMNNIDADGIKELANIKYQLTLTSLRLNGNKLGRDGGKYLAKLLEVNVSLEHLDIAETDLTIEEFVQLMAVLRHNNKLKCLDISRILGFPYYVLDIDQVVQVVDQMLYVNRTLVELHLQKMEITDFVLDILVSSLQYTSSLLLLDLSCNQIGDTGIEHIGNFLKTKPPLQALMLNHNRIRDTGENKWLDENISPISKNCNFEIITLMMVDPPKRLYLSYAIAFSQVRFLDVAHNNIGEIGVLSLLYTIRKEMNLIILFLYGNSVTGNALLLLELWLTREVLKQHALDVYVYRDEFNELQSGYNSDADLYNQRYYSVVGKLKRRKTEPQPELDDLAFKYHNIVHIWELPSSVRKNT